MSQNTQPAVINFVKQKSWYIPEDAASYQLLRSIKVPLLKVHQDFIPTLQLATKPKGIRAKSKPFADIISNFLDRVGAVWLSKPGRKCKLTEQRSSFTCPSTTKNRRAVAELDRIFQEFCSRWALSYVPIFSETNDKLKLVLDYKFDPERNPVIPAIEQYDEPIFELVLGFTKIKITFDVQRKASLTRSRGDLGAPTQASVGAPTHILEIFALCGTAWTQVHTASFTRDTIGEMTAFLGCLGQLHAQRTAIN